MTHARRLRFLPLVLACAAFACRRGDDAVPIRLVDRLDDAEVTSAVDLAAQDAALRGAAERLVDTAWDDFPAERRAVHGGSWIAPLLLGTDAGADVPVLHLLGAPVPPMRMLRATLGATPPPAAAFVLELPALPEPAQLADAGFVESVLREYATFLRPLAPAGAGVLETSFTADDTTGAVLLLRVTAAGAPSGRIDVRLEALSDKGTWLAAMNAPVAGASPWLRATTIGRVTREAIVLGAPGSASFRVRVPEGAPRLTVHAGLPLADPRDRVTAEASVTRGAEDRAGRVVLTGRHSAWLPIEIDLTALAGSEVEVELTARESQAPGTLVAFGTPVLDALRDDPRPDVVLISLDTVRADRLSSYGAPRPTSPHLDRLVPEAVVFQNAFAPAPWTLPSHVSLLSGQYPDRHGVHGTTSRIAPGTPWLPAELRRAGYRTLAFTGGGYVNPAFGFARGFEQYGSIDPAYPPDSYAERRGARDRDRLAVQRTQAARAELLDVLAGPRRGPLFLFVHTYAAHNYVAGRDDLLAVGAEPHSVDELMQGADTNQLSKRAAAGEDGFGAVVLRTRVQYDAALRVADRLVGDVVEALRRSGRLEHTVLIVTSDHGEELFERGVVGHGHSLADELIHVPLVIRAAELVPGRPDDLVSLVDVTPTLRRLCGLPEAAALDAMADGRNLLPLLTGGTRPPGFVLARGNRRDQVFHALRGTDRKYVVVERPGAEPDRSLFLLGEDPAEASDLAAARPDDVERLATLLGQTVDRLEGLGSGGVDRADLSAELEGQLRELGYLGGR